MIERDELIANLRAIDTDLDRIESAWLLFKKSAKDFGNEQDAFIDLINQTGIGGPFSLLQMILLHDCVVAICRITDHPKPNRVTLSDAMNRANALYASQRPNDLKVISSKLKAVRTSDEVASLRQFRDQYIAHTLKGEVIDARYSSIPLVAAQISEIVDDLYGICRASRWLGQASKKVKEESSSRFWKQLEAGMSSRAHPR